MFPPNVPSNVILPVTTPVPLFNELLKLGFESTFPPISFITILLVSISELRFCADKINLIEFGVALLSAALSNAYTFESVVIDNDLAWVPATPSIPSVWENKVTASNNCCGSATEPLFTVNIKGSFAFPAASPPKSFANDIEALLNPEPLEIEDDQWVGGIVNPEPSAVVIIIFEPVCATLFAKLFCCIWICITSGVAE